MSLGGHVGSSCTGERCLLSHSLDWFTLSCLMGDGPVMDLFSLKLKTNEHGLSLIHVVIT
jgi:hypothetical protein